MGVVYRFLSGILYGLPRLAGFSVLSGADYALQAPILPFPGVLYLLPHNYAFKGQNPTAGKIRPFSGVSAFSRAYAWGWGIPRRLPPASLPLVIYTYKQPFICCSPLFAYYVGR